MAIRRGAIVILALLAGAATAAVAEGQDQGSGTAVAVGTAASRRQCHPPADSGNDKHSNNERTDRRFIQLLATGLPSSP